MLSKKTNRIVLNIFSFLLLLTIFHNTSIAYLSDIGYYALLLLLFLSSVLLVFIVFKDIKAFIADKKIIIICYAAIAVLCLVGVFKNPDYNGVSAFIECILLMNFFLAISSLKFEKEYFDYNFLGVALTLVIIIMCIGMIGDETYQRAYMSIYDNSSAFGLRAFFFGLLSMLMYKLYSKKYFIALALSFIALVVFSNTRSCLLNIMFMLTILIFYKLMSKNKLTWYSLLALMFVFICTISVIYPLLYKTDFGLVLNKKVHDLTGKWFFSGRHRTWLASIDMALKKPILGYGTGKKIYELVDMKRKDPTHSLYLQMLLENGVFSLLAICTLFVSIWKRFFEFRNNNVIKYCVIFLLAIMFQSIFEVTLLQGNMLVGVLQWFILGIGMSKSREKNNI